ncbi:very-long-chain (3R)-3-hydroxyacyl-CoA dehydratase hpo-8-like [Brevipalpus obovatus]|uniref:very-long-chain (3R)-3-hydroxyacyl-CoA dehydratase hpo-8-like n=1 Tax=Brevipalpus obovatus TaxID=246614 RepID=UPI003D9EA475
MAQPKQTPISTILLRLYLVHYNIMQLVGWLLILYKFSIHAYKGLQPHTLWHDVRTPLLIFQTLQALDVFNSLVKFTKTSPIFSFLQVFAKIMVIWCVTIPLEGQAKHSWGIPLVTGAWSIGETIRYLYYLLKDAGISPHWLTWLRYTMFPPLYPFGIAGEMLLLFVGYKHLKETKLFALHLPNQLNVSFQAEWLIVAILGLYVIFFPQVFFYLLRQRRKVLSSLGKDKKTN